VLWKTVFVSGVGLFTALSVVVTIGGARDIARLPRDSRARQADDSRDSQSIMCSKTIILAAGLGSRMRRADARASLAPAQAAMAEKGLKAMISFGRPFLDFSLTNVADAGYSHVCLVIGPNHQRVREYYSGLSSERLEIEFAVQPLQLGTANALAAAVAFAGQDEVLVLNGDNYYPTEALRSLRETTGNAVVGFDRNSLIAQSNIPAERISAFSVMERDNEGFLETIIEKPSAALVDERAANISRLPLLISMNCWRFRPSIFLACLAITPSPRGEYELPDAVIYTIRELGERYRVIPSSAGVLDLSNRSDIEGIQQRLEKVRVRL
jgi:dTDP-glucose pyrophosphorylase